MLAVRREKSILLIEDRPDVANAVGRWLEKQGYEVRMADSLATAEQALDECHFHLAIVDIRLDEEDVDNQDGMLFIDRIEERGFEKTIPCIILTGHGTLENAISAVAKPHVVDFVEKKGGYRSTLLESVRRYFDEISQINFELELDGDSDEVLDEVVQTVWWAGRPVPDPRMLIPETLDLFGHLYSRARRIYISRLRPGLSGAATVRTHPTWEFGLGPSHVAKISRRDKIEIEQRNFERHVHPYLPANIITQVEAAYTQNLGAIQYTFAEDDDGPLYEFDEFYHGHEVARVVQCLENVIFRTCVNWYDARQRVMENIPKLYYSAFNLREERLYTALTSLLGRFDPNAESIWLERYQQEMTNPLWWLKVNGERCTLPVYHCITHGDLTGRNIMTRRDGSKCWLIDFYRTYASHALRDFVILETDIKYRLLGDIEPDRYARMESVLMSTEQGLVQSPVNGDFSCKEEKTIGTVLALRGFASKVSRQLAASDLDFRREYLLSLLMTTLNVTRLRHIAHERKLDALWSSASICDGLDAMTAGVT